MLNEMEIVNLTIGHKININLDVNLNCPTRKQCLQKVHRYKLNMHKLVFGGIKVLFQFKFWSKWYDVLKQRITEI